MGEQLPVFAGFASSRFLVDCAFDIIYDSPGYESGGFMWIIKSALGVIIFLAFLGFSFQNSYQVTTVNLAGKQYNSIPLIIVLYIAFSAGVIFWFIISIFQYFKYSGKITELKRKNKQLSNEIKALRNLPLEEVTPGDLTAETPGKG